MEGEEQSGESKEEVIDEAIGTCCCVVNKLPTSLVVQVEQ